MTRGEFWTQDEWADWSDRLAELVPEQYEDDVAQEAIVERALADLVQRAEAAEAALAAVRAVRDHYGSPTAFPADGLAPVASVVNRLDAALAHPTIPDAPTCTCVVGVCREDDEDGCCESPHCPAAPTTPEEMMPRGTERTEWGHAHADDPDFVVVTSERSARSAVEGWNSIRGTDGKAILMRRTVGEWEPVEEAQP